MKWIRKEKDQRIPIKSWCDPIDDNVLAQAPAIPIVDQQIKNAEYQLGTLGGGNHFVELQRGDDGAVWMMIHSGSRNFGKQIADAYHRKALALCRTWHVDLPHRDLAFLPVDTAEAEEYIAAIKPCRALFSVAGEKTAKAGPTSVKRPRRIKTSRT